MARNAKAMVVPSPTGWSKGPVRLVKPPRSLATSVLLTKSFHGPGAAALSAQVNRITTITAAPALAMRGRSARRQSS